MTGPAGVYLYAVDTASSPPSGEVGVAAQITGQYSIDGAAPLSFATTNPVEIGGGIYWQPLASAESAGLQCAYFWVCSVAHVAIAPQFLLTMPSNIKRGVARPGFMYYMASSLDGKSPMIGLAPLPTVVISKDSGAFSAGQLTNNREVGSGWYAVDWSLTDTLADVIVFLATAAGCDATQLELFTQP